MMAHFKVSASFFVTTLDDGVFPSDYAYQNVKVPSDFKNALETLGLMASLSEN